MSVTWFRKLAEVYSIGFSMVATTILLTNSFLTVYKNPSGVPPASGFNSNIHLCVVSIPAVVRFSSVNIEINGTWGASGFHLNLVLHTIVKIM